MRKILAGLLLIALTACGGGGGDSLGAPSHTLSGIWDGPIAGTTDGVTLDLVDASGNLSGTGDLTSADAPVPFTIAGTTDETNVTMTFTASGLAPITFTGTVSDTVMVGTATSAELTGQSITFTKQSSTPPTK